MDGDTSFAHWPNKIVDDLPHLFVEENIMPFTAGVFITSGDWIIGGDSTKPAVALQQLNAQPLWDFGNFYGEGWVEGFGALGSWVGGSFLHDTRLQEFGRDAGESLLLSTITVTGLKYIGLRERPDGSNNQSFPSGHTATAFSFAPVVAKYWGWGAGIAAYSLATVTACARVEGYHHYVSDVVAGATLGFLIGQMTVYKPKDVSLGLGPGTAELKLAFN